MSREWTLKDLLSLFPDVLRGLGARPVSPATGHGRYVKGTGGRWQFADVMVECLPAEGFSISFQHESPADVSPEVIEKLERGLLRGLVEAALRHEPPALGCRIVTTRVLYAHSHLYLLRSE